MPKNATRILFAILAIAFFAAPVAGRMLGIDPEEFENRRFADAPKLSQGWDAFQQTTQYVIDRMPLRAQAVRLNTRIWTDVLNTDPRYGNENALARDQALPFAGNVERDGIDLRVREDGGFPGDASASTGQDGWLYLTEDFEYACKPPVSNRVAVENWGELVAALRAKGHASHMFVAPMKASVYPEHLPEKYPFDHCAPRAKAELWRILEQRGPSLGVYELRSELMRLKAHAGDDLFEVVDSHWTTLGALTLVDTMLDKLGDRVRLESDDIVERGMVPYVGDLSVVGGKQETSEHMEYGIERESGAPRIPGRTLLICDSFAYKWIRLFRPYFEDFRWVSSYHRVGEIVRAIDKADTVLVEANELFFRVQADEVKGQAPRIARALRKTIARDAP